MSHSVGITAGVPQGPLLFSLYVNDIGECMQCTQRLPYANDLQIYKSCSIEVFDDCIEKINIDIANKNN